MKAGSTIDMNIEENYKEADLYIYQRLNEILLYLACSIMLDILFTISQLLSKNNANSRKYHFWSPKRVMRYLKGTMKLGLRSELVANLKNPPLYRLIGYIDSNFAVDSENHKLVMRYGFFLNGTLIS